MIERDFCERRWKWRSEDIALATFDIRSDRGDVLTIRWEQEPSINDVVLIGIAVNDFDELLRNMVHDDLQRFRAALKV
jgi:hypothetical protein